MNQIDLEVFRTINQSAAEKLAYTAKVAAERMGVKGCLMIYNRFGVPLFSCYIGSDPNPMGFRIAEAKAQTVLTRRQSTSVWATTIQEKSTRVENYAGAVKTLFKGGLAIFASPDYQEFIGAMSFSGGTEKEDSRICRIAIIDCGFYTDDCENLGE